MKMITGPFTSGWPTAAAANRIERGSQLDIATPDLSMFRRGAALNCEYSQVLQYFPGC